MPSLLATLLCGWIPGLASAQLKAAGNHRIFQDALGGLVEAGDHFGAALAAGDFDGDERADLAIGAPDEELDGKAAAGAVFVVYGAPAGLGTTGRSPLLLHQDVPDVLGEAEVGDRFGSVLAAGRVSNDEIDELVVGIPDEDIGSVIDAGAVQAFAGSVLGLLPSADVLMSRGSLASFGDEAGYRFGASVAIGYLGLPVNDPIGDLLVGIPGSATTPAFRGEVALLDGTGSPGVGSFLAFVTAAEPGARLGSAIATGDVNGDGIIGDWVVGAPHDALGGGSSESGVVWMLIEEEFRYEPIPLATAAGSHLGTTMVLGDFLCAGHDQILVGAPDAEVVGMEGAGAALLFDAATWTFTYIAQNAGSSFGSPDPMDHFGGVLAVGDFNADGCDDAAFGVPDEDLSVDLVDAGVVQVLYGSPEGFSYADNQLWLWGGPIGFTPLDGDRFGAALAAGDFNGDGADDLAIGAPEAVWSLQSETGIVQILYGFNPNLIFADGFEGGGTAAWSATVP